DDVVLHHVALHFGSGRSGCGLRHHDSGWLVGWPGILGVRGGRGKSTALHAAAAAGPASVGGWTGSISTSPAHACSWPAAGCPRPRPGRSEEHTSELQSRENLVCRLLLEKKKTQKKIEKRDK